LHSAQNIYAQVRKDGASLSAGTVALRDNTTGTATYTDMVDAAHPGVKEDSLSADWQTQAIALWNGNVKSSVQGVAPEAIPTVDTIKPQDSHYANTADIVVKADGSVQTSGGTVISNLPTGTITQTETFQNYREGTKANPLTIKMTVVDIQKLSGLAGCGGKSQPVCKNNLPVNGLLYVEPPYVDPKDAAIREPGVELVNGSQILTPPANGNAGTGLTVVTAAPVYIKGNYNNAAGYLPSSIIADAVNILSNEWNDANSTDWTKKTVVNPTTINCAFVAGAPITKTDQYNGGLENYPRLHENWNGAALNITGSFVELWQNQVAKGNWAYGSPYYSAPTRTWAYDAAFTKTLPPAYPAVYGYDHVAWWKD
jgi:hypothetical protein